MKRTTITCDWCTSEITKSKCSFPLHVESTANGVPARDMDFCSDTCCLLHFAHKTSLTGAEKHELKTLFSK